MSYTIHHRNPSGLNNKTWWLLKESDWGLDRAEKIVDEIVAQLLRRIRANSKEEKQLKVSICSWQKALSSVKNFIRSVV